MLVSGVREEAGEPGENLHGHGKNMQTSHRKTPGDPRNRTFLHHLQQDPCMVFKSQQEAISGRMLRSLLPPLNNQHENNNDNIYKNTEKGEKMQMRVHEALVELARFACVC